MSVLFTIAIVALLAVLVILALASGKPDTFRVERRATIAAPMETVFAQINDLVAWQGWSPWAKKDLQAKSEFTGTTSGPGAAFAWDGNKDVGKGRMTIIESEPHERVRYRLDFEKPFKGTNEAVFALAPAPSGGTEVTWTMTGEATLVTKTMDLLMNMDRMVGRDFEGGLAEMKRICEKRAA